MWYTDLKSLFSSQMKCYTCWKAASYFVPAAPWNLHSTLCLWVWLVKKPHVSVIVHICPLWIPFLPTLSILFSFKIEFEFCELNLLIAPTLLLGLVLIVSPLRCVSRSSPNRMGLSVPSLASLPSIFHLLINTILKYQAASCINLLYVSPLPVKCSQHSSQF